MEFMLGGLFMALAISALYAILGGRVTVTTTREYYNIRTIQDLAELFPDCTMEENKNDRGEIILYTGFTQWTDAEGTGPKTKELRHIEELWIN